MSPDRDHERMLPNRAIRGYTLFGEWLLHLEHTGGRLGLVAPTCDEDTLLTARFGLAQFYVCRGKHRNGRKWSMKQKRTPRRLRKGYTAVDTPPTALDAARSLTGWALGYHRAVLNPDGTLSVTLKLAHRGGLIVPDQRFRELPRSEYWVLHVHSYVQHGVATVWIWLRPVEPQEPGGAS
jgi:hypothetical protein